MSGHKDVGNNVVAGPGLGKMLRVGRASQFIKLSADLINVECMCQYVY